MPKRKSQEEFLKQVKEVHGDKFDYSRIVYTGRENKVEVVCNKCCRVFLARAHDFLRGHGCPYCAGVARSNTEEFIEKARKVHGDRYDYSLVDYKRSSQKVKIICKKHGVFETTPNSHLRGENCRKCAIEESKSLVCGVGINDYDGQVKINGEHLVSYKFWRHMLKRCYSESSLKKNVAYIGCSVCDEWKYYMNFKKWFDENAPKDMSGYNLDKDLIVHGNKIYSPDTCCFLPRELNNMLITQKRHRGECKIGVYKMPNGKFIAQINSWTRDCRRIGIFNTEKEAFLAYKREKERIIKTLADEYYEKGLITERVRDSMYNYKVMEDD